jgi:hypothetical protein
MSNAAKTPDKLLFMDPTPRFDAWQDRVPPVEYVSVRIMKWKR